MPGEEAGPAERKGSESTDTVQPEKSDTKVAGAQLPVASRFNFKSVLWTFGRCLSALLPVYLAGYYRISTGLLVFGLTVYTGWKHARDAKEGRLRSAMQSLEDGQGSQDGKALRSSQHFPGSIHIPDLEKVEWLNKVLQQAWPFVGQYLEKLLVESIAPSIRSSSAHLQTLSFTKIDMGRKPMKVVGVKVHTENDKGQILLDLYINYVGDVEIDVEVKRYFCKAGVKGIQLKGMMRVILEPLIGDVPIAAAVTMFFIKRPTLNINWTGLTNLLDIPGLNVMSDKMIMDAIASFLVLPNRLTVPLVAGLPVAQLRSPLPRGVVRIHLVEAQDLAAKDSYVRGVTAGISDPYAVLRVGPQSFTSHHVDNNLNPQWGEMYEVIVHEVPGQELEVEVYDKDPDQDDFLGRVTVDLGMVKQAHVLDEWFPLKDIDTGRLHLKMEWLSLLPSSDKLEQVIERNKTVAVKASSRPSAAILAVYLDRAEELPMKKGNKEPSPLVQLSVQGVTRESRMCAETTDPVWEDAFTFFLHVPNQQNIVIQVKDSDRVQLLGSVSIPLSRLLANHDLSVDDWFPLADAKPTSRISLRAVLRVLWLDEEAALHAPKLWLSGPPSEGVAAERPQHTSPSDGFATEGVLRIHLVEARNLIAKDNLMGGMVKGKSDPYVKTRVGGKTFRSHVVNKNLNPTWNELYEVILTRVPGQEVQFDLYDDDVGTDEFLGRFKVGLSDVIRSQHVDQWYTLNDVKSGSVHLVLDWMPTVVDPAWLDEVLKLQAQKSYQNKAVPSAALLFVYAERAQALPLKKSGKEPMVGVEIILGGVSYKTKVCDRSTSPKWSESFSFLVRDPAEDILTVKLSHNWGLALGSLFLRVKDLLSVPGLVLDSWLSIDGASADSEILLRAELKLLCSAAADGSGGQADVPSLPDILSSKTKSDAVDPNKGRLPTAKEGLQQKAGDSGHKETDSVSAVSPPPLSPTGPGHKEELPEDSVGKQPYQTTPNSNFATEGVLRIHLVEAQNLIAKDNHMGGMVKGKSDPYVKIHIGTVKFCSHVIKENLNPIWNELYEVVLTQQAEQEVQFEVYDKDVGTDDFLGRFSVSLSDIISSQYMDEWYTLSDVKSGHVHLVLEWVPKVQDRTRLDQVLQLQTQKSYQNKAVPTAALLFVYVERAHALPIKKSGKEPKVGAEIIFRETTYKTKVCDRSTSPQWDEAFHFLVPDPKEDILKVKLYHTGDQPTGSLVLLVRELLSEPGLVLDRWLSLDGVPAESQILLRAELKILDSKILKVAPVQAAAPASSEEVQQSLTPPKDPVSLSNQGLMHEAEAAKGPQPASAPVSPKPEKIKEEKHLETAVGGADQTGTVSVPASTPSATKVEQTVVPPKDTITPPSQEVTHKATISKGDEGPHPARASVSPTPEKIKEGAPAKVEPQGVSVVPSPVSTKPSRTSPDPSFATEGLLRIHLVEAQNLIAMDGFMAGGKSDPYVKICVGNIKFRSHVIKENLNPTWNELYEVVLTKAPGQEIQFELFDKDLDSDDFLGRLKVSLSDIISSCYIDKWYTLTDVKSGRIHLVLEWVSTVSDPVRLDQVLRFQAQQLYQNKAVPSAALLFVYIDRAHGLPLKKSGKEPKVGAELDLGATSYKTKVCDRSTSPHWGEGFYFLLHDPKKDTLILKLYHTGDQPTGSLVLLVREMLSEPGLVLDRWLSLDGVPAESQILLRAELKILEPKKVQAGDRGLPTVSDSVAPNAPGLSGQVKLSFSYPKDDKKLLITVHACRHLIGSSDPYVSFILLPDKNKVTKRKTGIKKKDANPEFNERFDFNISMDEARQKQLDLTVKNSTSFMSREKEVIGKVQIDLSSIDLAAGVTQWFDLKEES